jgi:hypothetical protein
MAGALRFEMISEGQKGLAAVTASTPRGIRGQRRLRGKSGYRR